MNDSIRLHCLQQVSEEGPACISDWIEANLARISYTHFYENAVLPQLEDFDVLLVMGGPMGVYEEEKYPWLAEEKRLIKKAIEAGKVVLGICLGAQLIASALGAKVYPGKQREIGWWPLQLTEQGEHILGIPAGQVVFHWHGDTFDLPVGATLLASSAKTPHQGFMVGDKVLALQFHMEVNEESLKLMTSSFADELQKGSYVQSAEEMFARISQIKANNQMMFDLLDRLLG